MTRSTERRASDPEEADSTRAERPSPGESSLEPTLALERPTAPSGTYPALEESRFVPGTVLASRYRIVSVLGRGGMGEVYRADDLTLRTPVALKFLPAAVEHDEKRRELFLEEVRIARAITHPNVCRVFDAGEAEGLHFLSMEYVDGEDLASLLRRIGRLPHGKAVELAGQIAEGLAAAHERGILHRDLKPANLMIDGEGRARITDFGLAALAASVRGADVRSGTPAYMAPEQHRGEEVSVQSDLYALGLVLYEMFTGEQACRYSSLAELVEWHRTAAPTPPSELARDLDPAVERIILRCLAKDSRERPGSAAEVAAALPGRGQGAVKTVLAGRLAEGEQEAALRQLVRESGAQEISTGTRKGDFELLFERPLTAARFALTLQHELGARLGIDLGEVEAAAARGPALTVARRLAELAEERQSLLTRSAFDVARQAAAEDLPAGLRWLAHGAYAAEGEEGVEVFEVGFEGTAPLRPPAGRGKLVRVGFQSTIAGWRPAPGLELPHRAHWNVERKLGEGGYGEVWLAVHAKTRERRVFKFCYEAGRLRALKREITLFRLLKEALGDRDDITRILDWNFDEPPYFIESEYTAGGDLIAWAREQGGIEEVALATRLEILAQVAEALAAAHSVGVLHKDVKPGNVLITTGAEGRPRARLTDFGVGLVLDRERLAEAGITVQGMTAATDTSSYAGTRLYMAPEVLEGKPATLQADIYALGVLGYQLVVGDFSRAMAPGWGHDVGDELLREAIAAAVDGSPQRRLSNALRLAEQLRGLDERRRARERERREREEAERDREELRRTRKRRKIGTTVMAVLAVFAAVMASLTYQIRNEKLRANQALQSAQQEALRANREAERANEAAAAAQQLTGFLFEVFEVSDPEQILERGAEHVEQRLRDQPEVQARLMSSMAEVYENLGRLDTALELAERALGLRREVLPEDDLEVVRSRVLLARLLFARDETEEILAQAEAQLLKALPVLSANLGEDAPETQDVLALLGHLHEARGDLEMADDYRTRLTPRADVEGEDLDGS